MRHRHILLPLALTLGAAGPTGVQVHSALGGQIFGFDIDQAGTEGVLTEAKTLSVNTILAATETFDQATGKIVKIVSRITGKDDYVTLGVSGASIGVVEREHVRGISVVKRIYHTIDPLDANAFTGLWTPPLAAHDIIITLARSQSPGRTAVLGFHNTPQSGAAFVLGTDIAANVSTPVFNLHGPAFSICCGPHMAYDARTNTAVTAAALGSVGGPPPEIAITDLATGHTDTFTGLAGPPPFGAGFVNGIAVDPDDGIAVTSTELDARLEYYDLKSHAGFAVLLPGNITDSQLQSGTDVEYDRTNRLFLVAQENSSTGPNSSIQVFDTKGNFVESVNGLNFSQVGNVIPTHIALDPATRTGYVDGPSAGSIVQFRY